MICERCNKKKAAVIYRENINGRLKALRLCGECTEILEQAGELEDVSAAVAGFSFPIRPDEEGHSPLPFLGLAQGSAEAGIRCPRCDATAMDMMATGRVGCAVCYTVFCRELSEALGVSHGGEHRGRVSAGYRARLRRAERLAEMKKQLKEAVASENYESAAGLRDTIRALEAEA